MSNKPLKIVAIVLGLLAVLLGWVIIGKIVLGQWGTKVALQDPKTFTDLSNGFSIERPADWESTSPQVGATSFTHESGANVTFLVEDLADESMTLEEYSQGALAQLPELVSDFQLVDSYKSKTGGSPSKTIEYTVQGQNSVVRAKSVWVVKKGKAYIFTFSAPENFYPTYEPIGSAIIESVRFK